MSRAGDYQKVKVLVRLDEGVGNLHYIYYLSTPGQNYLKEQGMSDFSRVRKSDIEHMKYPHLEHVLSVNDFLIAAKLLPRFVPQITLASMFHDLELKKEPVKVTVDRRMPGGERVDEKVTIIPDGWLDFRYSMDNTSKPKRRCIVLELDRGTTSMTPFKQKIRAYYSYAISEDYEALFGTQLIMVAYATTAGEARRKQMQEWCEQELKQQRLEHEANLFRFTALPEGELDPKQVFCEPGWYKPYEDEPVSLLWKL